MNTFQARYDGRCAECEHRIRPGDDVAYDEDELVHAKCVQPVYDTCGRCWLTMPCGCDDR